MLTAPKMKIVEELVTSSSKEELIWLNGYINGFVTASQGVHFSSGKDEELKAAVKKITIVFGTETGNSKKLATVFAAIAKKKGINAKIVGLDQYRYNDLSKEEYFFVIISTQGEGEPPASAKKFYEYIHQEKLSLEKLKYSVLALGDSSYPLYCQAGVDVDEQLKASDGISVIPLQKCDVDFEEDALAWFDRVVQVLEQQKTISSSVISKTQKTLGRKYYHGRIISNINMNDQGSNKETHHIEMAVAESVQYEPGDSLALVPQNRRHIIEEIIRFTGIDPALEVTTEKITTTVEELLTHHLNICYLFISTIKKYAAITDQQIPDTRMDLKDLLRIYPVKDAKQFVEVLRILNPIAPRLYSISSSPQAHGDEVHLTVSKNSFRVEDEQRFGLCSEFLVDQSAGTEVRYYIHKNRAFKLPPSDKDIIMVGSGTGIAPFRSFLAERDASGVEGKNWLFFGEQHFVTDFLYQTELQHFLQTCVLTKLSLAFSRDQEEKIYVQHRLKENKQELLEWVNSGAYFYVCGSKVMCADVEKTMIEIIGEEVLDKLKNEDRYQRDVY